MRKGIRAPNIVVFVVLAVLTSIGVVACGEQQPTPTPDATPTPRSRGQVIYVKYCNVCHPGGGKGSGPTLLNLTMPAGEIEKLVRHGKAQMPGFGPSIISEEDLYKLVEYVQGLGK